MTPEETTNPGETNATGIVRPHDCVIAFGIPTNREGFDDRLRKKTSDYALHFCNFPEYSEYYVNFVRYLDMLKPALRDAGVRVVHDVTSRGFAELFKRHRVVVLFSHWAVMDRRFPQGAIELCEGLVDVGEIVRAVPRDFDGYLDLCTCFPENQIDALLSARPRCRVKFFRKKAKPNLQLYFYGVLFQLLQETPMRYPEALARTRADLIGRAHEGDAV